MEPTLKAGQFVLVNRWATLKVGDIVVANDTERDIRVIKRVKKTRGNRVQVVGDNEGHGGEMTINKSQIIGRVIAF
ncbi:S26 family signal peptidase [Candidatus Microgenomates bacterium]|nr:S26 family signal peptidase [Candidatus Microgenomates bacterium]